MKSKMQKDKRRIECDGRESKGRDLVKSVSEALNLGFQGKETGVAFFIQSVEVGRTC